MSAEISQRIPTISTPVWIRYFFFNLQKQRKIAVIFRENSLQEIFKLGFSSLQVILNTQPSNETEKRQQDLLVQETLKLLLQVTWVSFVLTLTGFGL